MPIPIRPSSQQNAQESKYHFDASFLVPQNNIAPEPKKIVTASDKDADLIMKIWAVGKKIGSDKFSVANSAISARDFSVLKANGFVTGDINNCSLTGRAKKVITIMTLGENNSFLKKRVEKSYSEIMANSNKKMKTGYRIPKTASGNPVTQCKVKLGESSVILTREEWLRMGERMGWRK